MRIPNSGHHRTRGVTWIVIVIAVVIVIAAGIAIFTVSNRDKTWKCVTDEEVEEVKHYATNYCSSETLRNIEILGLKVKGIWASQALCETNCANPTNAAMQLPPTQITGIVFLEEQQPDGSWLPVDADAVWGDEVQLITTLPLKESAVYRGRYEQFEQ